MFVIGTAGHVDHGKSTLVKKLTGIDPDRLTEEKARGMTIDLGFAWLNLPDGNEVSIIDVPGHERFVNHMLAGVGMIDLALLVIAADESVMPQTKEHLSILNLLQIKRCLVAVTKSELVDADWLDLVQIEIDELLSATCLENSPIIPISSQTGDGIPQLINNIINELKRSTPPNNFSRPRVAIDRSFTIAGFGTVVTGTLIEGELQIGQEVEILPKGYKSRIRGLQSHNRTLKHAYPGNRIAVNLTGVSHTEIERGDVLTIPGWLQPTSAIDVKLKMITEAPRPIKHNMFATLHIGTRETITKIRLLEKEKVYPGEETWAQFKFDLPQPLVKDDYFVVRSNNTTLAGGRIIDLNAMRHKKSHLPTLERLSIMEHGSIEEQLLKTIELSEPTNVKDLVNKANLEKKEVLNELNQMRQKKLGVFLGEKEVSSSTIIFTTTGWSSLKIKTETFLTGFHKKFPLRKGAPKEELRSRLNLNPEIFGLIILKLHSESILVEHQGILYDPKYIRKLSPVQAKIAKEYIDLLSIHTYSPPTDHDIDPELLGFLVEKGKVVRVTEHIIFESSVYSEMLDNITKYLDIHNEISVATVRDMFGTSRKYALAIMDYLDQMNITRRIGDIRIRQPSKLQKL